MPTRDVLRVSLALYLTAGIRSKNISNYGPLVCVRISGLTEVSVVSSSVQDCIRWLETHWHYDMSC